MLTASAKTGRHVDRLLVEAVALADRSRTRIPTPQLNRFLSEVAAARQPPVGAGGKGAGSGHRLRLIFMTQTAERPPRFSIQVNSRARVTRDYAYFIENRLRERYRLEGVPAIIDFVARNERRRRAAHTALPRDPVCAVTDVETGRRRTGGARAGGRCVPRRPSRPRRVGPRLGLAGRSWRRHRGGRRCPAAAGAGGPPTRRGAIVPADALAYVNVALDRGRPAVRQALTVAARFPDFPLAGGAGLSRFVAMVAGGRSVDSPSDPALARRRGRRWRC